MKVIKIERDGSVIDQDVDVEFFDDEDTTFAEIAYGDNRHAIYYDDDAMSDPGMVRAIVAGIEIPLPAWIVGIAGEDLVDAKLDTGAIKSQLALPG